MEDEIRYLLSLKSIRERAAIVGDAAEAGQLNHFNLHEAELENAADFVTSVIKRDFGPDKFGTIPPHGRWQHFEVGVPRISNLLDAWKNDACDSDELTRRLIDLFFVSVLLDAGAGDHWHWTESESGQIYERSEGIAVASLHMFKNHAFAANKRGSAPLVNGRGLQQLATQTLAEAFQVSQSNPILGIESRADILRRLGSSLLDQAETFGEEGRPGNIVDHLKRNADDGSTLDVLLLWDVLQTLLIPIWPKDRTSIAGNPIGDAWPLKLLERGSPESSDEVATTAIQPFHKLTQWLTYSLMVPFDRVLGLKWKNADSLTALAEYRNGGLFVDLGVLSLKQATLDRGLKASGGQLPLFQADDDAIVEWRAMTLVLIDKLYTKVLSRMDGVHLTMAQLLEAGTWKSGREIAAQRRPETKSSPILIDSDGTVF